MRVALYARVSTRDKGQDVENQLVPLREYCKARQYEIVCEYCDNDSGGKPLTKREQGLKMLQDARIRKFDMIMAWALDRLTREGMFKVVEYLGQLGSYGVSWFFLKDPELSNENEMVRNIQIACMSGLAKSERDKIAARVKAGLERARAKGVRLGAPPKLEVARKIAKLKSDGLGKNLIAKTLGISRNTTRKYWQTN